MDIEAHQQQRANAYDIYAFDLGSQGLVVVDTLLCYMCNKRQSTSVETLERSVGQRFSQDQIHRSIRLFKAALARTLSDSNNNLSRDATRLLSQLCDRSMDLRAVLRVMSICDQQNVRLPRFATVELQQVLGMDLHDEHQEMLSHIVDELASLKRLLHENILMANRTSSHLGDNHADQSRCSMSSEVQPQVAVELESPQPSSPSPALQTSDVQESTLASIKQHQPFAKRIEDAVARIRAIKTTVTTADSLPSQQANPVKIEPTTESASITTNRTIKWPEYILQTLFSPVLDIHKNNIINPVVTTSSSMDSVQNEPPPVLQPTLSFKKENGRSGGTKNSNGSLSGEIFGESSSITGSSATKLSNGSPRKLQSKFHFSTSTSNSMNDDANKPYVCQHENCHKRFANKFLLKKHEFIHTGERPHQCIYCSKKFNRKDNLLRHRKTHEMAMLGSALASSTNTNNFDRSLLSIGADRNIDFESSNPIDNLDHNNNNQSSSMEDNGDESSNVIASYLKTTMDRLKSRIEDNRTESPILDMSNGIETS